MRIPPSFQMGSAEDAELDRYLVQRKQGNFTMGGVRFWPEMKSVSPELRRKAEVHRQMVTVFTNVAFDTSQVYASTVFDSVFDWLDETMRLVAVHPETLFVVRAHPDELRAGKESQEPVKEWLKSRGYLGLSNFAFIGPTEYVSSYELIDFSRFCIVYNSTIGLEATLLGTPVVTGGRTRYNQEMVTHVPASRDAYRDLVRLFLKEGAPPVPESWQQRARRFMYYSLFRASLDFSQFVGPLQGYNYTIKPIAAQALHPDRSRELQLLYNGIVNGTPFYYP